MSTGKASGAGNDEGRGESDGSAVFRSIVLHLCGFDSISIICSRGEIP